MSVVAGTSRYERPGERAGGRGLRAVLLHPAALGVLCGLALAVGLTTWFSQQAHRELAEDAWNRNVIMQLSALADIAAALDEQDVEKAAATLGRMLPDLQSDAGQIKVIRLDGARLLASTDAADTGEAAAPRRLSRNEKWLFDLAQSARAAVETNASEGVFRRRHVEVERLGEVRVRVTLPWFSGERVAGIVLVERDRLLDARGPSVAGAGATVLAGWLLMAGAVALRRRRLGPADPASRNWGLLAIGILLVAVLGGGWGAAQISHARGLQGELTADLAEQFVTLERRVALLAGEYGVVVAPGEENRWDTDLYQRPRGVIAGDGTVREEVLAARSAALAADLRSAVLGNTIAGMLLVAYSALGYATRTRRSLQEHRYAYLYVMPAMLGMLVLVFFPFAYGIALSFTDQTLLNVSEPITAVFNGLANYVSILGNFDVVRSTAQGAVINYQNFYWTLFITICWTVSNVTVGVTLGMILALVLNTKGLRFTNTYRVLLVLPWAIPNYITALIWKGMFHQQFGVINQAVQIFGGSPVAWFDGVFPAFMTGLITNGWLSFPFMMVVILGGLQSISQDMYEAATIDGAGKWQQFWNITLPSLKPTIVPAVIISAVWTFNMFNVIYLVSGGEPAGANEILITRAYKIAFEEYRYGYAAAYSVVIFVVLLAYGVVQARVTRATEATTA